MRIRTLFAIALLFSSWLISSDIAAQQPDTLRRTQEIVASFNKKKNKVNEKFGFKKVKYKEVRSEPVIKKEIADYSGTYKAYDLGYEIQIKAYSDGRVEANGFEPGEAGQSRKFSLKDGRIEGAL